MNEGRAKCLKFRPGVPSVISHSEGEGHDGFLIRLLFDETSIGSLMTFRIPAVVAESFSAGFSASRSLILDCEEGM